MNKLVILIAIVFTVFYSCSNSKLSSTKGASGVADIKAISDFMGSYAINDARYGTKTTVTIEGDKRMMMTNGLPNHETGEFPNAGNPNSISAQNLKYSFPIKPVYTGKPKWAREPGIALNGVKFEPETAEAFVCETGERYRIEAFQSLVDLGLDKNNAHVQPTGAYHYHGAPYGLIIALDKGEDIVLVGFAHDGFPIYYSKSGIYKPSYKLSQKSRTGDVCAYKTPKNSINKELKGSTPDGTFVSDWEYVKGLGDLDECNGIQHKGQYAYFVTDTYPYSGRCLMGEFTQQGRPNGPPPGGHGPPPGGRPRPRPNNGNGE